MNEPLQRKVALRQQIAELVAEYADLTFAPPQFVPGTTVIPPSGKVIGGAELHNMVEASLDGVGSSLELQPVTAASPVAISMVAMELKVDRLIVFHTPVRVISSWEDGAKPRSRGCGQCHI